MLIYLTNNISNGTCCIVLSHCMEDQTVCTSYHRRIRRELYAYILGYCERKECKLIRIGGMSDHIHMLVSIKPTISVSEFVQVLKTETSKC